MTISRELAEFATGYGAGSFAVGRNRIINGDMRIDARNAGASITPSNGQYSLDRWLCLQDTAGKISVQQNHGSVTPPNGFTNYIGIVSLSAYTPISSDYFGVQQRIEGYNVADFGFGAAGAKTITVSFWVRSSLTGAFGGSIFNSAQNRCYPFSYTINSANTWEYKTATISGDTTGTWLTNNGAGLLLNFSAGAGSSRVSTADTWTTNNTTMAPTGSVDLVATSGATLYITGVQLEEGTVATPFERRQYGQELALCQRYFLSVGGESLYERYGIGINGSTTTGYPVIPFPVQMRAVPTLNVVNLGDTALWNGTSLIAPTGVAIDQGTTKNMSILVTVPSGLTTSAAIAWLANGSSAPRVQFSSEL